MPKNEQNLELANFICRFGESLVMIDLLGEVVLPAFRDANLIRTHGESTSYKLIEVGLVEIDKTKGCVGVAGRFVKDTVLTSEQVLDPAKGLIQRQESIRTSPSALFLLMLDTHRLLYVKETSDAPGLDTFKATIDRFLRRKHKEFIDKKHREHQEARRMAAGPTAPLTKRQLLESYPAPELEIVPLASQETLTAFIQKYETLKVIEVQLLQTNHDIDNSEFFAAVRAKQKKVGAKRTTLKHSNPLGLEKAETITQLTSAVEQGIHHIKLDGKDLEGDRLRGNNEEFQIKTPIAALGRGVKEAAEKMFASFKSLVDSGTIKVQTVTEQVKQRIAEVLNSLP